MTGINGVEISLPDSEAFAHLSGDRNPVHINPLAARRLLYGQPVVHGMHLVLHTLDQVAAKLGAVGPPSRIKARFNAPLLHDTPTIVTATSSAPKTQHLRVHAGDRELASFNLESTTPVDTTPIDLPPTRLNERVTPVTVDESALANAQGSAELSLDRDRHLKLFSHLAELREWDGIVSVLLGATYVVGMLCPGMHSLLAGFEFTSVGEQLVPDQADGLNYRVKRFDARYRMVEIKIEAGLWKGTVTAFIRPTPAMQPSFDIVCNRIDTDEWAGRNALIVGGSRGLGEIAAKIVCAAGGQVTFTYWQGADDARRVLDDINSGGGQAACLRLDVKGDLSAELSALNDEPVSDILYFPSPHIDFNPHGNFDWALFDSYMAVYAQPLAPFLAALGERVKENTRFFWPSSTYIDNPVRGFAEYAAAKGAGELICRSLVFNHPKITVATPRLPPMRTDQTHSVIPKETVEPLDILMKTLLSDSGMHANARSQIH